MTGYLEEYFPLVVFLGLSSVWPNFDVGSFGCSSVKP